MPIIGLTPRRENKLTSSCLEIVLQVAAEPAEFDASLLGKLERGYCLPSYLHLKEVPPRPSRNTVLSNKRTSKRWCLKGVKEEFTRKTFLNNKLRDGGAQCLEWKVVGKALSGPAMYALNTPQALLVL